MAKGHGRVRDMWNWDLKLLGGFELVSRDGQRCEGLGRRDAALLAYLSLVARNRESRDRLASLLWGNRGGEQARHSLAQSTAALRKALKDDEKSIIVSESAAIALNPEAFTVDALSFIALAKEGSPESARQALEIYRGDLLPDFEVRSEGFDEWIGEQRQFLRTLAIDTHCLLAEAYAQQEDWPAVIEAAQGALKLDNLREDAHRQLIRGLAMTGQRVAALQQFNQLEASLREDLQIDPEPETKKLVGAIKGGSLAGPSQIAPQDAASEGAGRLKPSSRNPAPRWRRALYWTASGLLGAFLIAAVAVTATFWRVPELAPDPIGTYVRDIKTQLRPHPLSIAVLTFESHGDRDAAEFAEAISGGITTALSISSEMRVVSRSEARRHEALGQGLGILGDDLDARFILEGNVNKWGNKIIVETGLIDRRLGPHRIWSETYSREVGDFAAYQQDVVFDVIRSLEIRLTEGEQERINRMTGTDSLDAWLAAARGEKHLRLLTPKDIWIARKSYERALTLDSDYPGALEGLAWTYFIEARFGWTLAREEALKKANQIASSALELDPERPQTYSLLGSLRLLAGDYNEAVELGEKAFSMDPNDSDVAALLAYTLTYTGEPERALSLIRRAIELKPVAPLWYEWLRGRAHRVAGRPHNAIEILSRAIGDSPNSPLPLIELAAAYSEAGEMGRAKQISAEIIRRVPQFKVDHWLALNPYEDEEKQAAEAALLRASGLPD